VEEALGGREGGREGRMERLEGGRDLEERERKGTYHGGWGGEQGEDAGAAAAVTNELCTCLR